MTETLTFPSKSTPGKVYKLTFDRARHEVQWCDCPGFRFAKAGKVRSCPHSREVLGSTPPPPAANAHPVFAGATVRASETPMTPIQPMNASAMTDVKTVADILRRLLTYANGEWVLEEKFDGERVTIRVQDGQVGCWSRPGAGKTVGNEHPLPEAIVAELAKLPNVVVDGEDYVPGGFCSDVTRLDMVDKRRVVLFDLLETFGQSTMSLPYSERRDGLDLVVAHMGGTELVTVAEVMPVTVDAVKGIWARGGEGVIVKKLTSTYRPGWRSTEWIKVKTIGHETVTITGFEKGKAASSTPWSVTLFRRDNGKTGKCSTLNNATVEDVKKDPSKYIGKRLVIDHRGFTPSGLFRHGGWDHLAGEGE